MVHSHNLTPMQQFHRNFDLAVSQAEHPEIFAELKSEGEGIRLVKQTAKYLLAHFRGFLIPEAANISAISWENSMRSFQGR